MDRLLWLEGLLLPAALRRDLYEDLTRKRPPRTAVAQALRTRGSENARRRFAALVRRRTREMGGGILLPCDRSYPQGCRRLHDPPLALFFQGDRRLLEFRNAVGVIGARRGSQQGRLNAERMGAGLAGAGVVVVSGLAYGVDAASHRGCLAVGGRPVAVLGTGLDLVYPAGHRRLQREVARRGCLVTEYPPGTEARRHHFVARNRILAALSRALVVVEAADPSGTRSTVEFATDLGRDVLAMPGPPASPLAEGTARLIREGAAEVWDAADVLDELGVPPLRPDADGAWAEGSLDLRTPQTPEEIGQRRGCSVADVLLELAELELQGRVRRLPGGRYVAVPHRSS